MLPSPLTAKRPAPYHGGMRKLLCFLLLCWPLSLVAQPQVFATSAGEVKVTPLYHASTMLQAGGKTIYVDPAKPAKFDLLPKADLILVTHEHYDHFDKDTIAALSKPGTEILTPAAVASKMTGARAMANGERREWQGWTIEAVPAYNLVRGPAAGQFFHPKGRDNGYVLSYGGKRFYFSSDTEGTPEMRALKNIDVAFVCMNLPFTMPPEEAAEAVKAFAPKVVIPYHSRGQDVQVFKKKLEGTGIEVRVIEWYAR